MKFLTLISFLISFHAMSWTELNVEGGAVRNTYNRAAIPGDDGTQFPLHRSFNGEKFYHRLSLSHRFGEKHGVRFLYAPLRLTGAETYQKDILFQGVTFTQGTEIETEYQFNSYRGSYFYQLVENEKWDLRLGATLKVRDAKVKLAQGGVNKVKRNSGVVPLFYFFSEYKLTPKIRAAFDFDGWAAPQGRAFDGGLMFGYYVRDNMNINLGYRILEGGADNDKVYNFSRLEYLLAAWQIRF